MFACCCYCSVVESCLTVCDPMDYSSPSSSVLHCLSQSLLKLACIESMMLFNHLILCHSLLLLQSFPVSGSFPASRLSASCGHSVRTSATASVLPVNIQGWAPLGLTALISLSSKGLSRIFSSTTVWKHQFFSTQPSLWSNYHIIHDYWKNYSFDYMDLCPQSDISSF